MNGIAPVVPIVGIVSILNDNVFMFMSNSGVLWSHTGSLELTREICGQVLSAKRHAKEFLSFYPSKVLTIQTTSRSKKKKKKNKWQQLQI